VSLGIWPARFYVDVKPLKTHTTHIFLFNPGESDINVTLKFKCKNCIEDLEILNFKIGKVSTDLNVKLAPSALLVERNTTPFFPKNITIKILNSGLLKKQIETDFFGRSLKIPYYEPILNEREFKGEIIATTLGTKTLLSVTSGVEINLNGISYFALFGILSGAIIIVGLLVYYHSKKFRAYP
jgi:hypothetical protein